MPTTTRNPAGSAKASAALALAAAAEILRKLPAGNTIETRAALAAVVDAAQAAKSSAEAAQEALEAEYEAAGLRAGTYSEYRRAALARQQANPKYQAQQQQIRQDKQGKAPPARYRYERDDDPIPRDYLGIMAADHNRLDGRRRPSAGLTWTLI